MAPRQRSPVLIALNVKSDYGTLAASAVLSLSTADVHALTLGGNVTLTLATDTVPDRLRARVELAQDATGTRLVTWANVVWPGGTAPTLTATPGRIDVLDFSFVSSASKWRGVVVAQNYTA